MSTDVDSGPAIIPLAEAKRLVVGVRAGPLLRPVRPHLVLAMQPASVVVSASTVATSFLL